MQPSNHFIVTRHTMQQNRLIPISISQSSQDWRPLSLKLFSLWYVFVSVLFTVVTVSYMAGMTNQMPSTPNYGLFNVSFTVVIIFRAMNIAMMLYTKYFNFQKRNYFDNLSRKTFIVYVMFLPSLTATGVFYAILFMDHYRLLENQDHYSGMSVQNFVFDIVNSIFYLVLAVTVIDYSRWRYQVTREELDQASSLDSGPVVDIVLVNRYNILISMLGLVTIISDMLIYMVTANFIILTAQFYKVNYTYTQVARKSFNKNWLKFYPCVFMLSFVSVLFFVYKIKEFWFFVKVRKQYREYSGLRISGLNLSTTTYICSLVVLVVLLSNFIEAWNKYAYLSDDIIYTTFMLLDIIVLVLLLVSMKDWRCVKTHKPVYQQLFLYLGSLGRLLNNCRYLMFIVIGALNASDNTMLLSLGSIKSFLFFINEILLFMFIDLSMTKMDDHTGLPKKVNLLALLLCLHTSLSIISISNYIKAKVTNSADKVSFVNNFILNLTEYVNSPLALFFDVFVTGYVGQKVFKWYGNYERSH